MPCKKCGEMLLIDNEIASGVCLACMMKEFREKIKAEHCEEEKQCIV